MQRQDSVWVGTKDENGIESGGFSQMVEYDYVPEYCFNCMHQGHSEEVCYSQFNKAQNIQSTKTIQQYNKNIAMIHGKEIRIEKGNNAKAGTSRDIVHAKEHILTNGDMQKAIPNNAKAVNSWDTIPAKEQSLPKGIVQKYPNAKVVQNCIAIPTTVKGAQNKNPIVRKTTVRRQKIQNTLKAKKMKWVVRKKR